MTAADIAVALRKRYPEQAYALLFQVPNATGMSSIVRTADALVFGLWPSRGLDIEGIEIKASRSDWRREIADPSKAAEFSRYCHRWWIAAVPGIIESGELPPQWGLLELKRGVLRQIVEAPRSEPKPMPYKKWIAVMRAVQANELQAVRAAEKKIREQAEEEAQKRLDGRLEQLEERVAEFQKATGIDIRHTWNTEEIAEALTMVQEGRDYQTVQRQLRGLVRDLRAVADRIEGLE